MTPKLSRLGCTPCSDSSFQRSLTHFPMSVAGTSYIDRGLFGLRCLSGSEPVQARERQRDRESSRVPFAAHPPAKDEQAQWRVDSSRGPRGLLDLVEAASPNMGT